MKRVAVLRGGPSSEYQVSMKTGQAVLSAIDSLKYPHKDIIVTKSGEWLNNGFVKTPEVALEGIDVVFIALHGHYGEDGQVQRIMQRKNIPFTGSRALPSAIAFNKELAKRTLMSHGIKMPRHRKLVREELDRIDEEIPYILKEIGPELFIKPIAEGSSVGTRYAPNKKVLRAALFELFEAHEQLLIEEYIRGKEATVGILSNFREERLYALPVVEIIPPKCDTYYSNQNKYDGSTELICPGRFSYHEKSQLADMAATVHGAIGCDQYSRSDFIVKNNEIYFLEVNTLPGMTSNSLFPKSASAIGLEFDQLIQHLIETCTA